MELITLICLSVGGSLGGWRVAGGGADVRKLQLHKAMMILISFSYLSLCDVEAN